MASQEIGINENAIAGSLRLPTVQIFSSRKQYLVTSTRKKRNMATKLLSILIYLISFIVYCTFASDGFINLVTSKLKQSHKLKVFLFLNWIIFRIQFKCSFLEKLISKHVIGKNMNQSE